MQKQIKVIDSINDVWFRAEEEWRDDGSEQYIGVDISITEWRVTKVTRCGVWLRCITQHWRKPRFALNDGARAVSRSKTEALKRLIARKKRQIEIVTHQRTVAEDAIEAAKEMLSKAVV